MSAASNAIILLDLIQAGVSISIEIQELFRKAEMENRNVTRAELEALEAVNDDLYSDLMEKLQ